MGVGRGKPACAFGGRARWGREDGFCGAAGVACEDWKSAYHGFDGNDAEVFVRRCVEESESGGGSEEGGALGGCEAEEEGDLGCLGFVWGLGEVESGDVREEGGVGGCDCVCEALGGGV